MDLLQLTEPIPEISPSATLLDIARIMSARHMGVTAVIDDKRIVGLLTERDLGRRAAGSGVAGLSLPAREAMISPVESVPATTPVAEAAGLMRERGLRYLAVVNPKGEFLGLVSLRALLQELMDGVYLSVAGT